VINSYPVSVTSLKIVEQELGATIQRASSCFELYLADRASNHLEECELLLDQARGALKLLQLQGATTLAEEMQYLVASIRSDATKAVTDAALSALSSSFIAIPCYLEHITSRQQALPILLAPYIDDLRIAQRKDLIPESSYAGIEIPLIGNLPAPPKAELTEPLPQLVTRLRHMFQLGLLGVIRGESVALKARMMQRALQRLAAVSSGHSLAELWQLGEGVMEAFADKKLGINVNRKRLLSSLDKFIKALQQGGPPALDAEVPTAIKRELLFLIALSDANGINALSIREAYALPETRFSDEAITKERRIMQGPNAATISSMVTVMKEELMGAKEVLEIASQDISGGAVDFIPLLRILNRVADILGVVGLKQPGKILKQQVKRVLRWKEGEEDVTGKSLLEVADALLYVESALSGLDRLDLSGRDLVDASDDAKHELMARSQLQEAELLVIKEGQAGITLAKRAITSFVESNYDRVHISNVAVTLNTVRGGLILLNHQRGAAILASCIGFVQKTIDEGFRQDRIQGMLETLADALIALEHYLAEVEHVRNADDSVLEIAEESLAALGYPVQRSSHAA
jgi:hypothetical protein